MYGQRPNKRQRRIKPVARLGAVDIAVRYDIHNGRRIGNPENRVIHEGELVFSVHGASLYRDNSLHVLSDTDGANGQDVQFAGVAVTGFDPKHDVYEQGFVIQVSGLCSIFNNSGKTILPGQPLYALNLKRGADQLGLRHDKKHLVIGTKPPSTDETPHVGFVGTCVRGGRKGTTIDVVLHRSAQTGDKAYVGRIANGNELAESRDANAALQEEVASLRQQLEAARAAARSAGDANVVVDAASSSAALGAPKARSSNQKKRTK
jgi:hypothetical protein